jgi:tetratricopeptide (TPR) repeat protein
MTFARSPESIDLQRQALDIRTELFGTSDPRTAECKSNLGYALWHGTDAPDYARAEALYRKSIAILEGAPSEYRPDLARFTFSLAVMLHVQGRYEDAEPLFRRALRVYRNLPLPEDRYMVECMKKYGHLLLDLGRLDEAEDLYFEVLRTTPEGRLRNETQAALWRLGRARLDHRDYAAAERAFLAAIARACRDAAVSRPEHEEALTAYAHALLPELLTPLSKRPLLPALNLLTGIVWIPAGVDQRLFDLATCLRSAGEHESAESMLRTHLQSLDGEPDRRARTEIHLARVLQQLDRVGEARALLEPAIQRLAATSDEGDADLILARRTLAELQSAR